MTGAYLRVKRGDCIENVEVEFLTDEELDVKFGSLTAAQIMPWFKLVCVQLRAIAPVLQELEARGDIERVSVEDAIPESEPKPAADE